VVGIRTSLAAVLLLGGAALLALAPACIDLFHSTNFETLCDTDSGAPGCSDASQTTEAGDGDAVRSTDFCDWTSSEARSHAEHACAWLGACSSPFDHNAFGPCMIRAILAYDCTINPNRTIAAGALHDYWDALWQAASCADVAAALPLPGVTCGSSGYACLDASPDLRVQCVDGVAQAESCLALGLTCQGLTCSSPGEPRTCDPPSCEGTVLHACVEGGKDEGYDCRPFGAGKCEASKERAGCVPSTAIQVATRCAPSSVVTCDGGTASACPTGVRETIACEGLTGKDSCSAGRTASWNLAEACEGTGSCVAGCRAGTGESNDTLVGCGNGAEFATRCEAQGLGACRAVPLAVGTGYACAARP
jgi:hypothetical protein